MPERRRQLRSSLHTPDAPAWQRLSHYSSRLAEALHHAYAAIHQQPRPPEAFWTAAAALLPFRDHTVCQEQRRNLAYAFALVYAGEGDKPQALEWLAKAREAAEALTDWAALAELAYLEGAIDHLLTHHAAAYRAYAEALAFLQQLAGAHGPADPAFELDVTLRLAGRAWELGRFTTCLAHLDAAHQLRATWAADAAVEAASLAWLDAQVARVRGQPLQALALARPAPEVFETSGDHRNAGRMRILVAECALDVVEALIVTQAPGGRVPWARLPGLWLESPEALRRADLDVTMQHARAAIASGRTQARETGDAIGDALAQLAHARALRLTRQRRYLRARLPAGETGLDAVERVLRRAELLRDPALLGRAKTALGEELAGLQRFEAAQSMYDHARRLFEEHELGGLAFWPRWALVSLGAINDDHSDAE